MKITIALILVLHGMIGLPANCAEKADLPPPPTRRVPVVEELHGEQITDPFRWLEDQQSPETRAWIAAQNEHTAKVLENVPGREILQKQVAALLRTDSVSSPIQRGQRYFFARRAKDQDQYVLYMREGWKGKDQVLVDPHSMSPDQSTSVSFLSVSEDGSLVAYGVREGGEDEVSVRLLDVATKRDLDDTLPKGRYFGVNLLPDKSGFYYTWHDDRGSRVRFHQLGTEVSKDPEIFGSKYGPGEIVSNSLSDDGRYLLLTVYFGSAADKTEVYLLDRQQNNQITTVFADTPARVTAQFAGDHLLLQSNEDAPNGLLYVVPLEQPTREHWTLLVPTGPLPIDSVSAAAGRIYVNYLSDARSVVHVYRPDASRERELTFPMPGTIGSVRGRWESTEVFYDFSSYVMPTTIYGVDTATNEQKIWAKVEVPIDPDRYEVGQVWFNSKDKTRVPMFLVYEKGRLEKGKDLPVLMTGYGGFNISLTPRFSPMAALWVMQGGVFAVPNLRGGGEFGEEWHRAGMRDRKQNVFDDFIAAAEHLIAQGITSPQRLAISGRSNGGLLVGAAITQRPDLFRAAICGYPLLDMIRYHRFLVARFWVPEYGSAEDESDFRTLLAYSPYHRVRPNVKYPAVLFVTGDADTRVDPLHARKMTALLQQANSSKHPILLHYDTKAGHSAGKPIRQAIEDMTLEMSFLGWQLGMQPKGETATTMSAGERLHQIFAEEWEYTLRHRPTYATYLGDKRYNDRWPDVSPESYQRHYQHVEEVLESLKSVDPAKLDARDREHLQLFTRQYQDELEEEKYGEHLLPINQRGGIQTADELADAIAFESTKDYEDWIARLVSFPLYVQQTTDLMREGIRTGRLHPKVIMERLPEQLSKQIVKDPERSPFYKPFERFAPGVAPEDRQRLADAAQQAIQKHVVPSFQTFQTFFEREYFPACYDRVGIWQFPSGQAMYASVAKRFTTTTLSPDEIHKIGQTEVARIRKQMEVIIKEVGFDGGFDAFLDHLRTDPKFYYSSSEELLEGYRALSKRIDPTLTKLFRTLPRMPYGVEPIPLAIAPDTTTAYYRGPAADGSRAGTYFVNLFRPETRPKYEMEALSLHEAVPGHHLQIALAMELGELPPFRRHGGYTAFVEGWGLYAESLGDELGFYQDPYSKFGQLTYEMWRAVRLVVDTGMHHLAWSREQAIDFFKANAAKSELDITNEIDRYIAWPGQALAYKIGELKIKELRALATKQLGDQFDIRSFHEVVLGSGAVPLDVLEAKVTEWIREVELARADRTP